MNTPAVDETPRWGNYVLDRGESLDRFWRAHFSGAARKVLFILGRGFDPRMCLGLERLLSIAGSQVHSVLALDFPEGERSPSVVHADLSRANGSALEAVCKDRCQLTTRTIEMWSEDGRRVGSRNAKIFRTAADIQGYTDIFVDVSGLPRSLYFPLIASLLYVLDHDPAITIKPNLFVLISENVPLDREIADSGLDDTAVYAHGFQGSIESEATAGQPKVWLPVLGEDQATQLGLVYNLVVPDEICPILPFPSLQPRRGDDLIYEYRTLLFDELRVEPRNIIFASEINPFDVYSQIRRTILHYTRALAPLGGCKAVISAHSSKLLSVGALLVAYELKERSGEVAVAQVETHGYSIRDPKVCRDLGAQSELVSLWLGGECYEP